MFFYLFHGVMRKKGPRAIQFLNLKRIPACLRGYPSI